jgi:hypothetical protein
MSDTDLLELRVMLTRLASELAFARAERDPQRIRGEIGRVRASLDAMLTSLPAT